MRILGIDPSPSGSGIFSTFTGRGETIRAPGLTDGPRLDVIERRLRAIIEAEKPALIIIEGYNYQAENYREMMGEVGGLLRLIFFRLGYVDRYRVVPPTSLKKFARDKGSGDKKVIKAAVLERWGIPFKDDNQCDAFVLAKIGEFLARDPIAWTNVGPLTPAQFEVLKGVTDNPRGEMQRVIKAREKGGKK